MIFNLSFFLFIPNVHFNAADAILHRDSAVCIASSVFFHIAFFVFSRYRVGVEFFVTLASIFAGLSRVGVGFL